MKKRIGKYLLLWMACLALPAGAWAHSGDIIASPGVAGAIDLTDTNDVLEWAGTTPFSINNGHPNTAEVYALHRSDGIYMRIEVTDDTPNSFDAVKVYFDLSHDDGGSVNGNDFGIEITRGGGKKKWGDATLPSSSWSNIPSADVALSADALISDTWIVEFKVPKGAIPPDNTHTLDYATDRGKIGIYIQIYSALEWGDTDATTYNQWPDSVTNLPIDTDPSIWGNYEFDPATTFADVGITGIRNAYDGSEGYHKISHTDRNSFEVELNNPGGTVIADAAHTRINLYLAARGIGEPWRRIDEASVIDADCADANASGDWPSTVITNGKVCSGANSLDDITAFSLSDIVSNGTDYTIKNGQPMTRVGGESETISAGFNGWLPILEWDTTADQDDRFTEVVVGGTTYRRQHQCMKAEVIAPSDPNDTNNTKQVNMDFVSVAKSATHWFFFNLGWAQFMNYNPAIGKEMYLEVVTKNMPADLGWRYSLKADGIEQLGKHSYVAKIKGKRSLVSGIAITAPKYDPMGNVLKENLMIPPKAGGDNPYVSKKSGLKPIYVKVEPGRTTLIANYGLNEQDVQQVDMDGDNKLRPNGVVGQMVGETSRLLAPHIRLGALIGSFDNFRTAFPIGEGVQVIAPPNATHLALGINDYVGQYSDNTGAGFRVKISQMTGVAKTAVSSSFIATAEAAEMSKLNLTSISDVMPSLCINGYEAINEKREIGGTVHNLYRYIGNVCWGVINVFPPERDKPDQGDPGPNEKGDPTVKKPCFGF